MNSHNSITITHIKAVSIVGSYSYIEGVGVRLRMGEESSKGHPGRKGRSGFGLRSDGDVISSMHRACYTYLLFAIRWVRCIGTVPAESGKQPYFSQERYCRNLDASPVVAAVYSSMLYFTYFHVIC